MEGTWSTVQRAERTVDSSRDWRDSAGSYSSNAHSICAAKVLQFTWRKASFSSELSRMRTGGRGGW